MALTRNGMEIIHAAPPNIRTIEKHFKVDLNHAIFTFRNAIYNPGGNELPYQLIVHEKVHARQQAAYGRPDAWWDEYIASPHFRLSQELEAYREQYAFLKREGMSVLKRTHFANIMAKDLSSQMYGNIITEAEAYERITA